MIAFYAAGMLENAGATYRSDIVATPRPGPLEPKTPAKLRVLWFLDRVKVPVAFAWGPRKLKKRSQTKDDETLYTVRVTLS